MRVLLLNLTLLSLLLQPASAQTVVGRSAVEGQTILILSDGTWRYERKILTESVDCKYIVLDLSFCGSTRDWTRIESPQPDIDAVYIFDDRHFGAIVGEGYGSEDGTSLEFMRTMAINNAASVTNQSSTDVLVLDILPGGFDGKENETMIYQVDLMGIQIVIANSMIIKPHRIFQIMTWAIDSSFTDKHQGVHENFLDNIRIE